MGATVVSTPWPDQHHATEWCNQGIGCKWALNLYYNLSSTPMLKLLRPLRRVLLA